MDKHARYERARARVLAAETPDELTAAHADLAIASEPLADAIQTAWQANQRAVVAADQRATQALLALAATERRVCEQAIRRNRVRPVLNAEELDEIDTVQAALDAAAAEAATAKETFKAGVTVEQLRS